MKTDERIIWGLLGKNKGDNTQIEVLCHALGRSLGVVPDFKNLVCNNRFVAPNILRRTNLSILSSTDRGKLKAEWPDVLIGSGRKHVTVARWVQKQSENRTRLVWIGRPKAPLDWFDLVVSTPQYGLPKASNIYKLPLPLVPNKVKFSALAQWETLPRPWIGVLVGGAAFPLQLDATSIEKLGRCISEMQKKYGGTCLVSTSPRTGSEVIEKLRALIPDNSVFFIWNKNGENPHQAILSCADRFIVTGDSATMMAEACVTGKPVELFALKRSVFWPRWVAESQPLVWLVTKGVLAPPRDVTSIHDVLAKQAIVNIYSQSEDIEQTPQGHHRQEQMLSEITGKVRDLICSSAKV
jgi:mitochondrial fission protein ELM1